MTQKADENVIYEDGKLRIAIWFSEKQICCQVSVWKKSRPRDGTAPVEKYVTTPTVYLNDWGRVFAHVRGLVRDLEPIVVESLTHMIVAEHAWNTRIELIAEAILAGRKSHDLG